MTLYRGARRLKKLVIATEKKRLLIHRGRQVFPCRAALPLPQLDYRITDDDVGTWLELGFRSSELLEGNPADGWTDPRGYVFLRLERSTTLEAGSWVTGDFIACDDSPEDLGTGFYEYWSRCSIAIRYNSVLIDQRMVSDLYGKSITSLALFGTEISLPNYPYVMPTDASQLEADLVAAGYSGATVTNVSGSIIATARNHTADGIKALAVTQSGGDVTGITGYSSGTYSVSLPNFPYSMPSQQAALQSDLRTAGITGAVVMLHQDEWTILLPDLAVDITNRTFVATITPGDPFPVWDTFGAYVGIAPANQLSGMPENLRFQTGEVTTEAVRQFVRMAMTRGERVLP